MGAGLAIGLLLQAADPDFVIPGVIPGGSRIGFLGYNIFTLVLGGATISILCQMGFFAYLILRMVVLSFIRSNRIWGYIQILIIIIVLYETASLRYINYASEGESFFHYFDLPFIILVVSLIIAYWKVKLTNMNAFIPTLFFLVAGTIIEAVPALRLNNLSSTLYMIVPLMICNAWQILILHKLTDPPEKVKST